MAVHDFLTWLQVEGASPATVTAYKSDLNQFLESLARAGVTELGQVTPAHVRRFLVELKSRGLSNATLARRVNCLRSFFKYCQDEAYIEADPMRRITAPKKEKREPRYLNGAEVRRVLDAARRDSLQDLTVAETLAFTGIRRAELLGLDWSDVDFEANTLHVRGKGGKDRTLPLHKDLARDLWRLLQERLPLHEQAVFLSRTGGRLQRDSLKRIIDRIERKAGLPFHVTAHAFRHSFATRLVRGGVDLITVRDLLGHADVATTALYAHGNLALQREAVAGLTGGILTSWKICSTKEAGNKRIKVRRLGHALPEGGAPSGE